MIPNINQNLPIVSNIPNETNPLTSLDLFMCLEHAYSQVKFWHQMTSKYSEHVALGNFYEGLSALNDAVIEVYIAVTQRTNENFGLKFKQYSEGCVTEYLCFFRDKIKEYQSKIEHSDIVNTLDEIKSLINKTIYLLTLS